MPYQESVRPLRESVRGPESVVIQYVYLPHKSEANLRFYRNEIRFRPDGKLQWVITHNCLYVPNKFLYRILINSIIS